MLTMQKTPARGTVQPVWGSVGIQGKRGALQNRFGDRRRHVEEECYCLVRWERPAKASPAPPRAFGIGPTGFETFKSKYHLRCLAVLGSEIPPSDLLLL